MLRDNDSVEFDGDYVESRRVSLKLTCEDLAKITGIPKSTVSRVINKGEAKPAQLRALCKALDLYVCEVIDPPLHDLLTNEHERGNALQKRLLFDKEIRKELAQNCEEGYEGLEEAFVLADQERRKFEKSFRDIGLNSSVNFASLLAELGHLRQAIEDTDSAACRSSKWFRDNYLKFDRKAVEFSFNHWAQQLEIRFGQCKDISSVILLSDLLVITVRFAFARYQVWDDCLQDMVPLWPNVDLDRRGAAHVRLLVDPPLTCEDLEKLFKNRKYYLAEGETIARPSSLLA